MASRAALVTQWVASCLPPAAVVRRGGGDKPHLLIPTSSPSPRGPQLPGLQLGSAHTCFFSVLSARSALLCRFTAVHPRMLGHVCLHLASGFTPCSSRLRWRPLKPTSAACGGCQEAGGAQLGPFQEGCSPLQSPLPELRRSPVSGPFPL